eukprot:scaffold45693_cov65-Phaeocystis_antarctica.AAC.5
MHRYTPLSAGAMPNFSCHRTKQPDKMALSAKAALKMVSIVPVYIILEGNSSSLQATGNPASAAGFNAALFRSVAERKTNAAVLMVAPICASPPIRATPLKPVAS